jgi:hypothetical protein
MLGGQFRLILGTNWRFLQFLDAGLLVPYKGNNTQSTPPAGFQLKLWGKVVLQTSLVSLKACTIPFFAVFPDSYKAQKVQSFA